MLQECEIELTTLTTNKPPIEQLNENLESYLALLRTLKQNEQNKLDFFTFTKVLSIATTILATASFIFTGIIDIAFLLRSRESVPEKYYVSSYLETESYYENVDSKEQWLYTLLFSAVLYVIEAIVGALALTGAWYSEKNISHYFGQAFLPEIITAVNKDIDNLKNYHNCRFLNLTSDDTLDNVIDHIIKTQKAIDASLANKDNNQLKKCFKMPEQLEQEIQKNATFYQKPVAQLFTFLGHKINIQLGVYNPERQRLIP